MRRQPSVLHCAAVLQQVRSDFPSTAGQCIGTEYAKIDTLMSRCRYCGSMFRGHHCSKRCMNSISILRRQQTAAKLEQCYCDGTENFACQAVKDNMQRLCFAQDKEENNEVDVYEKPSKAFGPRLQSSVFNVVALFYLSSIWWAQA